MIEIVVHLTLSQKLDGHTRDRCPSLEFVVDRTAIASIRSDDEQPHLPLESGSVSRMVLCDDAISRVIDEEVWLAELARVITPGGELMLTLPATGPFAWLDALTIYRYITDVTHRGQEPDATLPTGWSRHYSRESIRQLLSDAGFEIANIRQADHALDELRMLGGLIIGNWLRGDRKAELNLSTRHGWRSPNDRRGLAPTTWVVTARKSD